MNKIKAAFLDRDGTIIKDVNYLSKISDIELLPGIIKFCSLLQQKGYKLFVVTNQSGIARGFFDEDFVKNTHDYLKSIFEKQNVFLEKFYYCPHHPVVAKQEKYLKDCHCRKPKSGMLLKAAEEFNINLNESIMFGDGPRDILAGENAGCRSFYIQDVLK